MGGIAAGDPGAHTSHQQGCCLSPPPRSPGPGSPKPSPDLGVQRQERSRALGRGAWMSGATCAGFERQLPSCQSVPRSLTNQTSPSLSAVEGRRGGRAGCGCMTVALCLPLAPGMLWPWFPWGTEGRAAALLPARRPVLPRWHAPSPHVPPEASSPSSVLF